MSSLSTKKLSSTDIIKKSNNSGGFLTEEEVLNRTPTEESPIKLPLLSNEELKFTIELNVIEHVEERDT